MLAANDNSAGKVCTKCGEWKLLGLFVKCAQRKTGYAASCRECHKKQLNEYAAANPEKAKAAQLKSYYKHKEKWRQKARERYWRNKEKENKRAAMWHAANKERVGERNKKWHAENKERKRTRQAALRSTPKGRIDDAISSGIYSSIKRGSKGGRKWETLVGYTLDELMRHLEVRFLPGMTWDNYGKGGWDIDHRIPKAVHNYETPEDIDFRRCWALSNLTPLWHEDNLVKTSKLFAPFQPSLALAIAANDNKESHVDAA